jgi:hypothetical protein
MQTFLPYPSYYQSARTLDRQRLGKQRVETVQILKACLISSYGWQNHPAVRMWRGHERELAEYGLRMCREWTTFYVYKDTCAEQIYELMMFLPVTGKPSWFGDTAFHRSHKSNLLRKNPEHYRRYWPKMPDDLPYIWPVNPERG